MTMDHQQPLRSTMARRHGSRYHPRLKNGMRPVYPGEVLREGYLVPLLLAVV